MTRAAPLLSVVVVTYQSAETIGGCLSAVAEIPAVVETIVVDNGSTDETLALIQGRPVELVRNDANLGFSIAANQGAAKARGPVLCFLNPDCLLSAAVVEQGLAQIEGDDRSIGVPSFEHQDGTVLVGCQPGYTRRKLVSDVLRASGAPTLAAWVEGDGLHHDRSWHWPIGACFFVARQTFFELGGFDRRFFLYMEDVVLGRALALCGGRTVALDGTLYHASRCGSAVSVAERNTLLDRARIDYATRFHGRTFGALLRGLRAALLIAPLRWLR
jgi:GT2 family glycosyltransferase